MTKYSGELLLVGPNSIKQKMNLKGCLLKVLTCQRWIKNIGG